MESDPNPTPTIIDRSVRRYLIAAPRTREDYWYRVMRYRNGQMWFHRDVPMGSHAAICEAREKPLKPGDQVMVEGNKYKINTNLYLIPVDSTAPIG